DGVSVVNTLGAGVLAINSATALVENSLISGTRTNGFPGVADGFGVSAVDGAQVTVLDSALVMNTSAALNADGTGTNLKVADVLADTTLETDAFLDGDGLSVSNGAFANIATSALVAGDYDGIQLIGDGSTATATGVLLRGDPMAAGGIGT